MPGPELRDDRDLALRLRDVITAATQRSVRGATTIGAQVSGGLDSSLILSLLVSLARVGQIPRPPLAMAYEYTAAPGNDDRPYLRSLERHLGVRVHRVLPADAAEFVHQPMIIDAMPAPSPILLAAGPLGNVARRHGVDVVLTGHGGDPVLNGDPRVFGAVARRGEIVRAVKGTLFTRGALYSDPARRLIRFLLRPLVEPLVPRAVTLAIRSAARRLPRWAGPALARGGYDDYSAPGRLDLSPGERYAELLQPRLLSMSSCMRVQQELLTGYAIRTPLLDDDLVRFVATLPPLALLRGGYMRGLMRESMRGLVPEDLRVRETKGAWYWFVEQTLEVAGGLGMFRDLADVRMLTELRLVEPTAFRAFFDECCRNPTDVDYEGLWNVLSAEAFVRQYAGVRGRGAV